MTSNECKCDSEEFIDGMRRRMLADDIADDVSDFLKIFGDSTRIRILWALHENELCVQGISKIVGMSISAVSHQLKTLKDAKLVKGRREGKQVFYTLCDEHINLLLDTAIEHITEDRK